MPICIEMQVKIIYKKIAKQKKCFTEWKYAQKQDRLNKI